MLLPFRSVLSHGVPPWCAVLRVGGAVFVCVLRARNNIVGPLWVVTGHAERYDLGDWLVETCVAIQNLGDLTGVLERSTSTEP